MAWFFAFAVFATLEYVNYYRVQLMHDTANDLQYLKRYRRLRRSPLASDLQECKHDNRPLPGHASGLTYKPAAFPHQATAWPDSRAYQSTAAPNPQICFHSTLVFRTFCVGKPWSLHVAAELPHVIYALRPT